MEQYSQYLMMAMKTKTSYSWEEQAFAQDARGPLGGFVWPPRSYSCSFCRREFRSAQALGGHMNVHRRERAKLKQTVHAKHSHSTLHKSSSLDPAGLLFPSRVSSLGQESLDSNSDTKSCVYDDEGHHIHGNGDGEGDVETDLFLGFELDSCLDTGSGCKRRKTVAAAVAVPPVMVKGLDLELRLAS